ncbi:MAG: hypothetical protein QF682_04020 [Candidatus Thermoplasmatota archaeon]|nr:hypothetical protein [Candidatus Thermoplasmatota archaeon]
MVDAVYYSAKPAPLSSNGSKGRSPRELQYRSASAVCGGGSDIVFHIGARLWGV